MNDFYDVNQRLTKDYKVSFLPKSADGCDDVTYSGISEYVECLIMQVADPLTADPTFTDYWRQSSPQFEKYLLNDGWQKQWPKQQPIGEILSSQSESSIGVNYSKTHGKVVCRLSFTWAGSSMPNQLQLSEDCSRGVGLFSRSRL